LQARFATNMRKLACAPAEPYRRHVTKNRISRLRRRSGERADPSRLRLWPIGWALAACFLAAVVGLAGLSWLALALLHHPKLPRASPISLRDLVGVLQLVFASVAGAGALVARGSDGKIGKGGKR
jgi:hypothetical protein